MIDGDDALHDRRGRRDRPDPVIEGRDVESETRVLRGDALRGHGDPVAGNRRCPMAYVDPDPDSGLARTDPVLPHAGHARLLQEPGHEAGGEDLPPARNEGRSGADP